MRVLTRACLVTFGAAIALAPAAALAQSTDGPVVVINDSVTSATAVPELPMGPEITPFKWSAGIDGNIVYDDNILAKRIKKGDWASLLSPWIGATGDVGAAKIALHAQLDRYDYFNNSSENRTDWFVGGNARVPVSEHFNAIVSGGFSQEHEDRGDPHASATDASPTRYNLWEANAALKSTGLPFLAQISASFSHHDFVDNRQTVGGIMNNDDRDRDNVRASASIGYQLKPGVDLFGRAVYESVNYSSTLDDFGRNRDSEGYRAIVGLNLHLIWGFYGEAYGGYMSRSYKDAAFKDVHHAVYGWAINWIPGPLWSFAFNFDPLILEAVDPRFSGSLTQSFSIRAKHKFTDKLSGTASVGYSETEYFRATTTSTSVSRTDSNYTAGLGLNYAITRNIDVGASYKWAQRTSTLVFAGDRYTKSVFMGTLRAHF